MEVKERSLAFAGNTYQPGPRYAELPQGEVMDVVSFINEDIYQKCYKRLFVEGEIPQEGFYFSFYPTLRSWIKENHPKDWKIIREKISRLPDKEYKVLGGMMIHAIGPLESEEDLRDLIAMERKSFKEDFGFEPKGFWPPETAISTPVLSELSNQGYEFVMLRDSQIDNTLHNPAFVQLDNGKDMAIFHFNTRLSGQISYEKWTTDYAPTSMEQVLGKYNGDVIAATDTELYGWHGEHKEQWLREVLTLIQSPEYGAFGFQALSVRKQLEHARSSKRRDPEGYTTKVFENSSWSCEHGNLGRWTGECDCGYPSDQERQIKRDLYHQAHEQNLLINAQLNAVDPKWREKIQPAFVELRDSIFNGRNFTSQLEETIKKLYKSKKETLPNSDVYLLYAAKIYDYISRTSCAWFFPEDGRPERDIARFMTRASAFLLQEYGKRQKSASLDRRENG